ncbi:TFIIH/NER complex ATP-dependent 5'-3' DNA helicase subunit [Mitosporidium daphniae]
MQFIVLRIEERKVTKDGHEIFTVLVADESGSIELYVWDELGSPIRPGDILRLQMGMAQKFKDGVLRLYLSKISVLRRIGRFNMVFRESPNFSKKDQEDPRLDIYFPYETIYPEQYKYMCSLKRVLDAKGHGLIEMPSGTGKTAAILSLVVSYHLDYPEKVAKIIYCTRTVPEIDKALEELKNIIQYRLPIPHPGLSDFLGIGLSSRKNLCINSDVQSSSSQLSNEGDRFAVPIGRIIDGKCHERTASWARASANSPKCDYFENLELLSADGVGSLLERPNVYTLSSLKEICTSKGLCPYFLARKALLEANIVIFGYPYLLDPKISDLVCKDLPKESIVIFDEAHNIDQVCIEGLSVKITPWTLDNSTRAINALLQRVQEKKETDLQKLTEDYNRLIMGLRQANNAQNLPLTDLLIGSDNLLDEVLPGNLRKAEHFLGLLRRWVEYLKTIMKGRSPTTETPLSFMLAAKEISMIEAKPMQLSSLVRSLESTHLEYMGSLQKTALFASIMSTYGKEQGTFLIFFDPVDVETLGENTVPVLFLSCLDATIAMRPIFEKFSSVLITSGTLSPLTMFPRLLGFRPALAESLEISLTRPSFLLLSVTRGSDQLPLSSRFSTRHDPSIVRNYGQLLIAVSSVTPDGLVVFFPSYLYMSKMIASWNELGIFAKVQKLIFVEEESGSATAEALMRYRQACENGRGAVLLSVARGKVSEGVDFDGPYGRTVLMVGMPFQYTESRTLRARLSFLRDRVGISEGDFLSFDALRQAAQCLGRVLRGKKDYGVMILADKRYARADQRQKLPLWMGRAMPDSQNGLCTDSALSLIRKFFKGIAQPLPREAQLGSSLWTEEDILRLGSHN